MNSQNSTWRIYTYKSRTILYNSPSSKSNSRTCVHKVANRKSHETKRHLEVRILPKSSDLKTCIVPLQLLPYTRAYIRFLPPKKVHPFTTSTFITENQPVWVWRVQTTTLHKVFTYAQKRRLYSNCRISREIHLNVFNPWCEGLKTQPFTLKTYGNQA